MVNTLLKCVPRRREWHVYPRGLADPGTYRRIYSQIVKERQMEFDTETEPETFYELFGDDTRFLGE